jgi:hypothetical protein
VCASKMMVPSKTFPSTLIVNVQKFYVSVSNDDFASINPSKVGLAKMRERSR